MGHCTNERFRNDPTPVYSLGEGRAIRVNNVLIAGRRPQVAPSPLSSGPLRAKKPHTTSLHILRRMAGENRTGRVQIRVIR